MNQLKKVGGLLPPITKDGRSDRQQTPTADMRCASK